MLKPKKGTLAIIDADGLLFYAGWAYREQLTRMGELAVKERVDKLIGRILDKVGATHYIGFYGKPGEKNFRHDWATMKTYKGNRTEEAWQAYFKPRVKDHFLNKWKFHPMGRIEADDAVVIAFHELKDDWNIVMVGEDKDAQQIGEHLQFNPNSDHFKFISHTHESGRKHFWKQMMLGDSTDNIGGIAGVGKKNKALVELMEMVDPSEEEMYEFVRDLYVQKYGEEYKYHMLENYMLLCMLTKPSFDYPEDVQPVTWNAPTKNLKRKLIKI
jgi:hypothetical protein